ncbi:MAG TPA: 50S ribosomal protein L25 [Candidatus Limnocylindrales bacterium]|nr:50S ribosomal protein L25 [Candidatus Limnocylindrales bacterium]
MADRPALAAERRTVTGKAVARLRKAGQLPAVVYGHGTASEPVTIDAHEFELLRKQAGASTLVDLKVEGGNARPVLLSNIQVHPVNRRPIHVDLFAVRMTEELTVEVQLVGTGTAPASEAGGTLVHPTSSVKIRALPANLPDQLTYDLGALVDYDTTITVADLVAPEGVTIQADPAEVIARVLAPRVEEAVVSEAPEIAEGGEPGAEGGASDAAEGDASEG